MKIIQLVFHLGPGGAEVFVTDLSNALSRMGHKVVLLMIRDSAKKEYSTNIHLLDAGIKVRSLALKTGFHINHIHKVCAVLDEEKPDVVHGHLGVMPFVYLYSVFHKNIRFIHTIHSTPTFDIKNPFSRNLARFFYKRTIVPVTISRICAEQFEHCYRFRSHLIVNGRNLPSESTLFHEVHQELSGMPHPIFIHVARNAPEKNQKLLFDAFNRLDQEGQCFSLLVIGQGFFERAYSKTNEHIHLLGQKDNVCDYLRLGDAFCLTSLIEGSPISLIEALGCGATPICTPAGGIPDMIQDAETGYLSHGFELDDYLDAIHRFLRAPIPRPKLKHHYYTLYSMQECANNYLNVYSLAGNL